MTSLDLDELERLAEAATPGPWENREYEPREREVYNHQRWICAPSAREGRGANLADEVTPENAAFIAAFNPSVALSLLARIEELEAENARLNDRNAEVSMLAHKWMVAHDMRAAGKPYDYPEPADLPKAEARAEAAERRLSVAVEGLNQARASLCCLADYSKPADDEVGQCAIAAVDRVLALASAEEGGSSPLGDE